MQDSTTEQGQNEDRKDRDLDQTRDQLSSTLLKFGPCEERAYSYRNSLASMPARMPEYLDEVCPHRRLKVA